MTAVTQVHVTCDRAGCGEATGDYAQDASSVARARSIAFRLGWTRTVDGRDLCPRCGEAERADPSKAMVLENAVSATGLNTHLRVLGEGLTLCRCAAWPVPPWWGDTPHRRCSTCAQRRSWLVAAGYGVTGP